MTRNVPVTSTWFYNWRPRPQARVRLFCFPYAGGGASIYRTWSEHILPEIEICPLQLPGRENRLTEKQFPEVPLLIDALAAVLLPYLDMPYAFFGHSMGAILCFELARHLRRTSPGSDPIHLFVSGRRAPQLPDLDPPTSHLPEVEFIEELRRLGGTPEEVLQHEELLQLLLPLLRADFALVEKYRYKQENRLSCPITAFGGLQDESVPRDAILAWREQTSSSFRSRFFPGGHFFLHKERSSLLQVIAQELLTSL